MSPTKIDWQVTLAQHDRWLRTVAVARVRERQAVDEVMQEVALAAVKQAAPLADHTKVAPWLYRLVVVPSFFLIMDDVSRFLGWLFGRFVGKKDDELLAMEPQALTHLADQTARTVTELEKRIDPLKKKNGERKPFTGVHHSTLAAE